jgi:hypothetical protein
MLKLRSEDIKGGKAAQHNFSNKYLQEDEIMKPSQEIA